MLSKKSNSVFGWSDTYKSREVRHVVAQLSADMRTSPVADKFLPADGHEISPAAVTSSPQN